jgi:NifU-like protein
MVIGMPREHLKRSHHKKILSFTVMMSIAGIPMTPSWRTALPFVVTDTLPFVRAMIYFSVLCDQYHLFQRKRLMWDYSETVRRHYLNPSNAGEIENPDGVGEVGNLKCGDAMRLTFKLDDAGKIADIKFKTFGCGSAIASASILTELCQGKTLDEVAKITNQDIADALGGLPEAKMHCSVMGQEALEAAIRFYKSGGKQSTPSLKEGHAVCTCFGVTREEIEAAIRGNNLRTVDDVTHYTKAGGGCGGCIPEIEKILREIHGDAASGSATPASGAAPMTTLQKIDRIRRTLDAEIRPVLQQDGGDCELIDVDGNTVIIKFTGHCAGCAFVGDTRTSVVQNILRTRVYDQLVVVLA